MTIKVQMALPEAVHSRLVKLKEITEAASYADVIKKSLRFLEMLEDANANGSTLLIRDKDGTTREITIL